jgi:hypothetical protein
MAELVEVSGSDLLHVGDLDIVVPANSSNSTTTQSVAGVAGGSAHLTCGIEVDDPGDSDHAWGGVESSWAVFARSPGAGSLRLGIQFGALSLRASGSRYNEWGWSSHEVYASLHAFARALYPEAQVLRPDRVAEDNLIQFWNVDLGTENEAKMRMRTGGGVEVRNLNQDRWDETLVAFPPTLNHTYRPSELAEGGFVAFLVGFRLTVSAPSVNDYDFKLKTESMASIAWVSLESLTQDAAD